LVRIFNPLDGHNCYVITFYFTSPFLANTSSIINKSITLVIGSAMSDKILVISPLTIGYGAKPAINFAGLELKAGEQCLITGPSGCGKTTLLYAISGLMDVMSGRIDVCGKSIHAMKEAERDRLRGLHIGMVFQTLHLVKSLSVMDNLMLVSAMAGIAPERGRAVSLLEQLGIADKKNSFPHELSQGQSQRVAIARALLHKPALLLADEPTSSLDDAACEKVISLLKNLSAQCGSALLVSTHDSRVKRHFTQCITLAGAA
jgi:ABC-type lipoprotein export system ATPase subunit